MANLQYFNITIAMNASLANPNLATTFQAVTPWGQGQPQPTIEAAVNDALHRGGSQYSGPMYNYMSAQTLNGASGSSGASSYTTANTL